ERTANLLAGRNEEPIADHQGSGDVAVVAGMPGDAPQFLAALRLDTQQAGRGEEDRLSFAVQGDCYRRGIGSLVVSRLPGHLPCRLVEGCHARALGTWDDQHQVA